MGAGADEAAPTQQQARATEDAVPAQQDKQRAGPVGECSQPQMVSWMAQMLQPPTMRAAPLCRTRVPNAWNAARTSPWSSHPEHQ